MKHEIPVPVTETPFNIPHLIDLREILARLPDSEFSIAVLWSHDYSRPHCGSIGCTFGHLIAARHETPEKLLGMMRDGPVIIGWVAKYLGLSYEQAQKLYTGQFGWRRGFTTTREQVIHQIDRMLTTGKF